MRKDELLAMLPRWLARGADVHAELARPGVLDAKELAHLQTLKLPRFTAATRAKIAASIKANGPLTVRIGPTRAVPLDVPLPEGAYDLTVAFRLGVVNETLAALYAAFTVPHTLSADTISGLFTLDELRGVLTGIPSEVAIGPLHLTAPPTVSAIDGISQPMFSVPVTLDFVRTAVGPRGPQTIVAATLSGVLTFGLAATIVVDSSSVRFAFTLTNAPDPSLTRLVIAASSPVQPSNVATWDAYIASKGARLQYGVANALDAALGGSTIAPQVGVPGVDNASLFIRGGDVGVVASSDGGALLAGIQLGLTASSSAPNGNLGQLGFPFHSSASNVWARAQGAMLDKVVRAAFHSGAIQNYVNEQYAELGLLGSATVNDIETKIEESAVTIGIYAEVTGICLEPIDVWFRQKLVVSVFNGEIRIERTQSSDVDTLDEIACALITLAFTVATLGVALGYVLGNIIVVEVDQHDPLPITVDAMLGLLRPVPGTESVANVEVLQAQTFNGYLDTLGALALDTDNDTTFVYAQFFQQDLMGHRTPIAGASVRLLDRDWPPVAGDDVKPPADTRQVTYEWKLEITTETRYQHPTGDQSLGVSTTDAEGRVRFALSQADLRSSSGRVRTMVTTKRTDQPNAEPVTTVTYQDVPETQPDLYFAVTAPGQNTWTTPPIVNVHTRHVGTVTQPLQYTVGGMVNSSG